MVEKLRADASEKKPPSPLNRTDRSGAMIQLTRAEMETHIMWDAEAKAASLYTCDPVTIRRMDKLVQECPEAYRCTWQGESPTARRYTFPARYVRFGKPVSEAQREANKHNGARNAFSAEFAGEFAAVDELKTLGR